MTILGKRLSAVADLIEPGETVADIGSDHALLPIYLIENHITDRVIIGELGDGPYRRAEKAVKASSASNKIELRQGNGLQVLEHGEVQKVILAGMGGDTIVEILADDWKKAASFKTFIFQPMSKAAVLRQHLASQGWMMEEERLGEERGRMFLLLVYSPADCPYQLNDLESEIGISILRADTELKRRYINRYLIGYNKIREKLLGSHLPSNQVLVQKYQDKIIRLEALLKCQPGLEI